MSSAPEGFPSQQMPKGGKQWVAGRYWPIIGVTAVTVYSMWVWWGRKTATDVELQSPDTRGSLPNVGVQMGEAPGYGRKSAEASGMMEGDRAFQGIFPTKKIIDKMPSSGQGGKE